MTSRLLFLLLSMILAAAVPATSAFADESALGEDAPKPKKKKKAKRKGFDYEKSKYKSFESSDTNTYKFNEKGDPIVEKKKVVKKKKRSEPPEVGMGSEACGSEESCIRQKSEADAL